MELEQAKTEKAKTEKQEAIELEKKAKEALELERKEKAKILEQAKQEKEDALNEGLDVGVQKGKLLGWEDGVKHMAKNALKKGLDLSIIAEFTGLSESEVEEISRKIK